MLFRSGRHLGHSVVSGSTRQTRCAYRRMSARRWLQVRFLPCRWSLPVAYPTRPQQVLSWPRAPFSHQRPSDHSELALNVATWRRANSYNNLIGSPVTFFRSPPLSCTTMTIRRKAAPRPCAAIARRCISSEIRSGLPVGVAERCSCVPGFHETATSA